MQGSRQAERKGIGFGVAGPPEDRAADVAGLGEPLGGKLQQPRGEWRAEPRARRGLFLKMAANRHDQEHSFGRPPRKARRIEENCSAAISDRGTLDFASANWGAGAIKG